MRGMGGNETVLLVQPIQIGTNVASLMARNDSLALSPLGNTFNPRVIFPKHYENKQVRSSQFALQ